MQRESHLGPKINLLKNICKEYKERLKGRVYRKGLVKRESAIRRPVEAHPAAAGHGCRRPPTGVLHRTR